MLHRFSPINAVNTSQQWYLIFVEDEAVIWLSALFAVLIIPFVLRTFECICSAYNSNRFFCINNHGHWVCSL